MELDSTHPWDNGDSYDLELLRFVEELETPGDLDNLLAELGMDSHQELRPGAPLTSLWNLLKTHDTVQAGSISSKGLVKTSSYENFESMSEFEIRYRAVSMDRGRTGTVVESVEDALGLLEGKTITDDHISCASKDRFKNPVLCIHYTDGMQEFGVAILGLTYLR